MIAKLPYGSGFVACDLRGLRVFDLKPAVPKGHNPAAVVAEALDEPLGSPKLSQLAAGKAGAVIVVPDVTRKAHLPLVLPLVLAELERGGVTPQEVTLLVACGTHPPVTEQTLHEHLGPLPAGIAVVQHDARDEAQLVRVGLLADGTPVRLHRLAVEAPLVISIFTVQHHYFAGFGGGPKMIFPGVAGYEEIQKNHARVLDLSVEPPRVHVRCQPGVLQGNPVAEEILQVARLRQVDWALSLVLDQHGQIAWAKAGHWFTVWQEAVSTVRAWYEVQAAPFSRIVVSAGGFPTDHTLIQAHKAFDAASRFITEGGEILLVAELGGGAGSPTMEPFLDDPQPEVIAARLKEHYVQYGHTTLRIVDKTRRFRVHLVSKLDPGVAQKLGFHLVASPQEVLDRWRDEAPGDTVGVMAGAPVYPGSREGEVACMS